MIIPAALSKSSGCCPFKILWLLPFQNPLAADLQNSSVTLDIQVSPPCCALSTKPRAGQGLSSCCCMSSWLQGEVCVILHREGKRTEKGEEKGGGKGCKKSLTPSE
jgi:hypothetical protein